MILPVAAASYGFGILAYCGRVKSTLRWFAPIGMVSLAILNVFYGAAGLAFSQIPYFFSVGLYFICLAGLTGVLVNPPAFMSRFLILGEESYALYATHLIFLRLFGFVGIVYALIVSFGIEYGLRHKEINRRIATSYPNLSEIKVPEKIRLFWSRF